MGTSALAAEERVANVKVTSAALTVSLKVGRVISVPLAWYPCLVHAKPKERKNWRIAGGGYGIHWPDLDEDLSTEGLLRGAPSVELRTRQEKVAESISQSSLYSVGNYPFFRTVSRLSLEPSC